MLKNIANTVIEILPEPSSSEILPKTDLKILGYKLDKKLLEDIDHVVAGKFYFSRSELIRLAFIDFWLNSGFDLTTPLTAIKLSYIAPKISVSSKLPRALASMLAQFKNNLTQTLILTESIQNYLVTKQPIHTYGPLLFHELTTKRLKVIAFRLPNYQIVKIDSAIQQNYLESRSETIRLALIVFLEEILSLQLQTMRLEFAFQDRFHILEKVWGHDTSQICTKMPITLLQVIDTIIQNQPLFWCRTNFIRLAVDFFLTKMQKVL